MTDTHTLIAVVKVSDILLFEDHMMETYSKGSYSITMTDFAKDLVVMYHTNPEKYQELHIKYSVIFNDPGMAAFFKLSHGRQFNFKP